MMQSVYTDSSFNDNAGTNLRALVFGTFPEATDYSFRQVTAQEAARRSLENMTRTLMHHLVAYHRENGKPY